MGVCGWRGECAVELFLFGLGSVFFLHFGRGCGFLRVALERVAEANDERFLCGQFACHLLGFEVCKLFGERDAWQVLDLPSVAGAC